MRLVDKRNRNDFSVEVGDVLICEADELLCVVLDTMDDDYSYAVMSLTSMAIIEKYANLDSIVTIVDGDKVACEEFLVLDIVPSEHIVLTAE